MKNVHKVPQSEINEIKEAAAAGFVSKSGKLVSVSQSNSNEESLV